MATEWSVLMWPLAGVLVGERAWAAPQEEMQLKMQTEEATYQAHREKQVEISSGGGETSNPHLLASVFSSP